MGSWGSYVHKKEPILGGSFHLGAWFILVLLVG